MSNTKECTLTDSELIEKVDMWVTDLTHSGGKKWCLRVPADHNHDPDFIFTEAARRMIRYASRISELEGKVEFYRRETSKLRDYLEEHKIGKPSQKLFDALYEHIAELEAENKRLIEQHRWIPVTERLPEDEGIYLVLCPKYVEDPIVARWNNERWFDNEVDFHQDITDRITHWMVIPQPPKEQ